MELSPERQTETSITVRYTPEAGVNGSQAVAVSRKLGRFVGTCDAASGTCSVGGLSAGFVYDIWVRTCSASGVIHCVLRARPAQILTYPRGMFFFNVSYKHKLFMSDS